VRRAVRQFLPLRRPPAGALFTTRSKTLSFRNLLAPVRLVRLCFNRSRSLSGMADFSLLNPFNFPFRPARPISEALRSGPPASSPPPRGPLHAVVVVMWRWSLSHFRLTPFLTTRSTLQGDRTDLCPVRRLVFSFFLSRRSRVFGVSLPRRDSLPWFRCRSCRPPFTSQGSWPSRLFPPLLFSCENLLAIDGFPHAELQSFFPVRHSSSQPDP